MHTKSRNPARALTLSFCSKVRRIIVPITSVAAAENRVNGHRRRHGRGEARAGTLGPGPGVAVLAKVDAVGALVARVPGAPACTVDDVAHGGVLEDDAGVFAPRPAQIVGAAGNGGARGSGDVAVVEDVVRCAVRGGTAVGCEDKEKLFVRFECVSCGVEGGRSTYQ